MNLVQISQEKVCPFLSYSIYTPNVTVIRKNDYYEVVNSKDSKIDFQFFIFLNTVLTKSKIGKMILFQIAENGFIDVKKIADFTKSLPRLPHIFKSVLDFRDKYPFIHKLDYVNGNNLSILDNIVTDKKINYGVRDDNLTLVVSPNKRPIDSLSLQHYDNSQNKNVDTMFYSVGKAFYNQEFLIGDMCFSNEEELPKAVFFRGTMSYRDDDNMERQEDASGVIPYQSITGLPYFKFEKGELKKFEFEGKLIDVNMPGKTSAFADGHKPKLIDTAQIPLLPIELVDLQNEIKRAYTCGLIVGEIEFVFHNDLKDYLIEIKSGRLQLTKLGTECLQQLKHPLYFETNLNKLKIIYSDMLLRATVL